MQLDAADLADFYESPLGLLTRRIIARQLRAIWPSTKGACLLGYGFAVPYLRPFQSESERTVAVMPAQQGVVAWPADRPLTALTDEEIAAAFSGCLLRPHPGRAWAGRGRRHTPPAAPALACAGPGGAPSPRRAQPHQPVGATRTIALRGRPSVQPRRTRPPPARRAVRTGHLGSRLVCAAVSRPPADPHRHGMGPRAAAACFRRWPACISSKRARRSMPRRRPRRSRTASAMEDGA